MIILAELTPWLWLLLSGTVDIVRALTGVEREVDGPDKKKNRPRGSVLGKFFLKR
jgi:hypothetical protein